MVFLFPLKGTHLEKALIPFALLTRIIKFRLHNSDLKSAVVTRLIQIQRGTERRVAWIDEPRARLLRGVAGQ